MHCGQGEGMHKVRNTVMQNLRLEFGMYLLKKCFFNFLDPYECEFL